MRQNTPHEQPYDQNPYAGGPGGGVPQPHPKGTTVLVLGIVAIALWAIGIVINIARLAMN